VHVVHELVAHPAPAGVLSHLIEKVGSYAGFAAIIGLAVLAALYFSQARDVKRLRDWAGRAPERAAEFEVGGRTPEATAVRTGQPAASGEATGARPISQPTLPGVQPGQAAAASGAAAAAGAAAPRARPAGSPAPAPAAAAGNAAPATAQRAATPAGAAGSASPATAGAAPAATRAAPAGAANPASAAKPASQPTAAPAAGGGPGTGGAPATGGAPPASAQAVATASKPVASAGAVAPARANAGAKVLPARAAPQRPRPVIDGTAGGATGLIPPAKHARDRAWTAPRYLALIVAGAIVLGLGGTFGVLALTGGKKGSRTSGSSGAPLELPSAKQKSSSKPHRAAAPPIDPSTVTVSVLNATQVTGLASRFGQRVSGAGFRLGNVATASQQQRAESVVLYRPGSSRQARAVARRMGISQIEPADAQSGSLAGAATVIVVVGVDKSKG